MLLNQKIESVLESLVSDDITRKYETFAMEGFIEDAIEIEEELAILTESFYKSDVEELKFMSKKASGLLTEESVTEGQATLEIAFESFASGAMDKLKALWVKMKNATIAWFNSLKATFDNLKLGAKGFLDKYSDKISGSATIKGYKINAGNLEIPDFNSILIDTGKVIGSPINFKGMTNNNDEQNGKIAAACKTKTKEVVKMVSGKLAGLQTESAREFKSALEKKVLGEKTSITYSAESVKLILTKEIDGQIESYSKAKTAFEKAFNEQIAGLDALKKKEKGSILTAVKGVTRITNLVKTLTFNAYSITQMAAKQNVSQARKAALLMVTGKSASKAAKAESKAKEANSGVDKLSAGQGA